MVKTAERPLDGELRKIIDSGNFGELTSDFPPSVKLTEAPGSFIDGNFEEARKVSTEGRDSTVYSFTVNSIDANVYDRDNHKVEVRKGDRVALWGTGQLNFLLAGKLNPGDRMVIYYTGKKTITRNGKNTQMHSFKAWKAE